MLLSGKTECGAVTYRIEVYFDRNRKWGDGTLHGDQLMLMQQISRPTHTLRLEDGSEMGIAITRADFGGAAIKSNGPIPGF